MKARSRCPQLGRRAGCRGGKAGPDEQHNWNDLCCVTEVARRIAAILVLALDANYNAVKQATKTESGDRTYRITGK